MRHLLLESITVLKFMLFSHLQAKMKLLSKYINQRKTYLVLIFAETVNNYFLKSNYFIKVHRNVKLTLKEYSSRLRNSLT